ncbi:MAG: LptF/LptG family permease [Isosphaeraceae bacterium]
MRILDRQRYWAFLKAYLICFTALVGLYVVIDAFSNVDEFMKRAKGTEQLFKVMGRYYLVHMSEFYDRLFGVISMMAAIFTVTWMQRNNELLAMLAAGISTQRVIRPVIVSAVFVSVFAVLNQEIVMPGLAEELQKSHADDGTMKVQVYGRYDANGVYLHGTEADRDASTVQGFNATFPADVFGSLRELEAAQARHIPATDTSSPLNEGWLLRGARLQNLTDDDSLLNSGVLVKLDDTTGFPKPIGDLPELGRESYFLKSGIGFEALTRKRQWYQYAPTVDLLRGLTDPANEPEKSEIALFLHVRLLRPLLSITLLCLSLPLVLGGHGRNMFINLGLSLGTAAVFYASGFLCQFLGTNEVITAELAAWLPLIVFGSLAVGRWGAIRT